MWNSVKTKEAKELAVLPPSFYVSILDFYLQCCRMSFLVTHLKPILLIKKKTTSELYK